MSTPNTASSSQLIVTVDDARLLNQLKKAISMLKGVGSITIKRVKNTGIELAHDDVKNGRVTKWDSVDNMFSSIVNS